MEKVLGNYVEPIQERKIIDYRLTMHNFLEATKKRLEILFIKRGLLLFIFGFMLGRAFILSTLSPFSLPFFAAAYFMKKNKTPAIFIGLVSGALTVSIPNAIYSFGIISLFLIIYRIGSNLAKNEMRALPYYVLGSIFIGRLLWHFIETSNITLYHILMSGIEASLAFVLTIIFLQSIPLLTMSLRKQSLKTEEIVSLIILLASMMTGTIQWEVEGLTVSHVLSRYLVLIFAFTAGATVGSTVGVVTGLIFGLANIESFPEMSLLAFSGLLGGLLKEGKKIGVSFGLLIATLLIGMYGEGASILTMSLYESLVASLLFFLTPKSLTNKVAKHIPGTAEYSAEQQQYMRKIRDVTARRVDQFSSIFQTLSKSFSKQAPLDDYDDAREMDYFLSNVTEKTCQMCFKKENCWVRQFNKTYDSMTSIMTELSDNDGVLSSKTKKDWSQHCIRSDKVVDSIQKQLHLYQANQKLKKQVQESRRLVADQLLGVSEVMSNFAKEIQKERANHEKQEEQLIDTLQSFGLEIDHIEIYNLEQGNVDIDITIPYCGGMGQCEKLIAPLLSDILGETITVYKEECAAFPHESCYANFRSAKKFVVDTGVAHAAKDGGFLSGDSYTMIEIGAGKYALAISDGMGNGERAHNESYETLLLLKKILQSGIDEEVAIKSINSILTLRTTDEIYATLDLAIIDLQDAKSKFIKVGSTPSFIKRSDKVIKIQANNLPIGILQEFEVDVVSEQLKAEDILIMMSDGIFEGPKHIENIDLWLKRKILEIETNDPQEIADLLMEEVIRTRGGYIEDDMTVVVAKIKHNNPKWKTIPVESIRKYA
ncbi:stage II sporulation protein E [Caldibacillus lycopersici]|uniref:Stage II sporulation protein E n=1 Tax=Perspicuibacillus lycopersici TaxID=1325689 RepID=A0AAE3IV97_9BACI|nr:stage II sporulation protein E [Perspicuibacillus lycopersici]MCU9615275.1 stage II sporulation protein E [Perspicuibacillus lycopersici]